MGASQDSEPMVSFGKRRETQALMALMFYQKKVVLEQFMQMMSTLVV